MRMLFDGKACVNGCTFCCSRSARWIFKLLHHLHVHLIVFVWWRARPETFGEEVKAQDGTFVHYFLLNIPLLNFQSATQLIRIFFPLFVWSLTVQVTVMLRHGLDIASIQVSIVISPKDEYLWDWPFWCRTVCNYGKG